MSLAIAYLRLTKPRVTALVIMTSVTGYFWASPSTFWNPELLFLVAGVVLSCSGAATLNQYLEYRLDARMQHTVSRPIPAGMVQSVHALAFGVVLILSGVILLYAKINLITAFLSLLSAVIYVVIYTPMKQRSWLSTSVGAVSGALPPVIGWTAVSGTVDYRAWIFFLILFIWQHPHFYAIAWMYRSDYRSVGFKVLSAIDTGGKKTFRHIFVYSMVLVPVSLLPWVLGMSGVWYGAGALAFGTILAIFSTRLFISQTDKNARQLFNATIAYLPALLIFIVLDNANTANLWR